MQEGKLEDLGKTCGSKCELKIICTYSIGLGIKPERSK